MHFKAQLKRHRYAVEVELRSSNFVMSAKRSIECSKTDKILVAVQKVERS